MSQAAGLDECTYHEEELLGLLTFKEILEKVEPAREAEVGEERKRKGRRERQNFKKGEKSVVQRFQEDLVR